jgi:hypothetical protein
MHRDVGPGVLDHDDLLDAALDLRVGNVDVLLEVDALLP